ncbi:MAG: MaoC family dehydratase [Burkholderiales bacterium]|nr:MaoC family dehydratase [Burkholderiales bacterium]
MLEPKTHAPRAIKLYFEDFQPGQVREARGPTLTEREIVEFARLYDPQPFHIDAEAARQSPYGGIIASGWQTGCIAMRLMCELYLLEAASLGSPGVDEIRWTKPVRPGDTLNMKMTVLETKISRSRPNMGSVRSRWEVFNQHGELVMHMTGWGLFARRRSEDR